MLEVPPDKGCSTGSTKLKTNQGAQRVFLLYGLDLGPNLGPRAQIWANGPDLFFKTVAPGPGRFFSKRIVFGNRDPDPHHADF